MVKRYRIVLEFASTLEDARQLFHDFAEELQDFTEELRESRIDMKSIRLTEPRDKESLH
jgi:ATP-dependent protease HslVU (ClpYQ) peptidase subunit